MVRVSDALGGKEGGRIPVDVSVSPDFRDRARPWMPRIPSGPADPAWAGFWSTFEHSYGAELRHGAAAMLRDR